MDSTTAFLLYFFPEYDRAWAREEIHMRLRMVERIDRMDHKRKPLPPTYFVDLFFSGARITPEDRLLAAVYGMDAKEILRFAYDCELEIGGIPKRVYPIGKISTDRGMVYFVVINGRFEFYDMEGECIEDSCNLIVDETVLGGMDCSYMGLKTLEGCPKIVRGDFLCNDNKLESLKGAPQVSGLFDCSHNELTSLEGATFATTFDCSRNDRLRDFTGLPWEGQITCDGIMVVNLLNTMEWLKAEMEKYKALCADKPTAPVADRKDELVQGELNLTSDGMEEKHASDGSEEC